MGRPPGALNKTTRAFRTALMEAFEKNGAVAWLTKWGKENPTEFFKLMGRLIPVQVEGTLNLQGAKEVGDDELAAIARGGGAGADRAPRRTRKLH